MSNYSPPIIRLPRSRFLMETNEASGLFKDHGRLDNATVAINGDPTITNDFDPDSCTIIEVKREYLDLECALSADMANIDAANIREALLGTLQIVAAGTGNFTSVAAIADNMLLNLEYAPEGTLTNGVFTPDPFTSAEDSTGSPVTLVEGTHYDWYDGRNGILKLLDTSGLTGPLIFTGPSRAEERSVLAEAPSTARRVTLLEVDQRNTCTGARLELWRTVVETGTAVQMSAPLDTTDPDALTINFMALEDSTRAADALLGRFGYYVRAPVS